MSVRASALGLALLGAAACDKPLAADDAATSVDTGAPAADAVFDAANAGDGQPLDAAPPVPDASTVRALRLNEVSPEGADGAPDWIELVVVGDQSVDLSRYQLVDSGAGHTPQALGPGSLAPGGFLVVYAAEDADTVPPGAARVAFQLGHDDALTLSAGELAVDGLAWTASDVGPRRSFGRLPDGTGDPQVLTPTPGAPNAPAAGDTSIFDPSRLVPVAVTLSPEDARTLALGLASPTDAPLAAQLVLDDAAERPVGLTVATDGAWTLDLDPQALGVSVEGQRRLVLRVGGDAVGHVRDVLALSLSRDFDLPAPRASLALVAVNGGAPRLATLSEAVDADFAARTFERADGALWRVEPPTTDLVFHGREPAAYPGLSAVNPAAADATDFIVAVAALSAGDPAAYDAVFALEPTLRTLAVAAALSDFRAYGATAAPFVLHDDRGHLEPVALDLSGAFGGPGCTCDAAAALTFPTDAPTCGPLADRPLLQRLLASPPVLERWHGLLRLLSDGPMTTLSTRVDTLVAVARMAPAAALGADFDASAGEGGPERVGLARFARERPIHLAAQIAGTEPARPDMAHACP